MFESIDIVHVVAALKAAVLEEGVKEVAGEVTKSTVAAGKKVLGWLKKKLTGAEADALEKACKEPEKAKHWKIVKMNLRELVEDDPQFAAGFLALLKEALPEAVGDRITQRANVGDGAEKVSIVIVNGSDNQISQK